MRLRVFARENQSLTSGKYKELGSYSEIAIIYRSNSQGGFLEGELRAQNIPYRIAGGKAFFDQKECKDVLAYIKSAFLPNEISLRRIINVPPRGVGLTTLSKIADLSQAKGLTFPKALSSLDSINEDDLQPRAINACKAFQESLKSLMHRLLSSSATPGRELLMFLEEIGFKAYLEKHSRNGEVFYKKWRSVETMSNILDKFVNQGGREKKSFLDFIETMELRDSEEDGSDGGDAVNLMTLHASKGLEFPSVIMLGLEEDILPHRTLGSDINEERRLFYVGVTRAKHKLILTRCLNRRRHGRMRPSTPSRFLQNIDPKLIKVHQGDRPMKEADRKNQLSDLFDSINKASATKRLN